MGKGKRFRIYATLHKSGNHELVMVFGYHDKLMVCRAITSLLGYEANAQIGRGETHETGLGGPHGIGRIERLRYEARLYESLARSPLRLLFTRRRVIMTGLDSALDDTREGGDDILTPLGEMLAHDLSCFFHSGSAGYTNAREALKNF